MKRVLVAFDAPIPSEKALDLAAGIAGKYGAEQLLLHVMPYRPSSDAEWPMAEAEYLNDLVSGLDAAGIGDGGDPRRRAQRVLRHCSDVAHRFREAGADRLMNRARARFRRRACARCRR